MRGSVLDWGPGFPHTMQMSAVISTIARQTHLKRLQLTSSRIALRAGKGDKKLGAGVLGNIRVPRFQVNIITIFTDGPY